MIRNIILILSFCSLTLIAKQTITQADYNYLKDINDLIKKEKTTKAIKKIDKFLKKDINILAKSYALQSLANINLKKGNYKKVAQNYEKIVSLNALIKEDILNIKYSLSKIYLSLEEYSKSIKYSKELLNKRGDNTTLYENLALGYYYFKKYKESIFYIKKALKNNKEKENWYKMLYSAYVEIKDYKKAINTLKVMVKRYNNESYWMQLISLYEKTKQKKKSLSTLELAYNKGVISKNKNLLYLVSILSDYGVYHKAARYMKEGLENKIIKQNQQNFSILVSSYLNAKNYKESIKLLENSSFAKNDKFQLILGNIYYNNNNYKNAIRVLKKHNFTRDSKANGKRYTLLALSYYESNKSKSAVKKYLKKASKNRFERRRAINLAKSLGLKI